MVWNYAPSEQTLFVGGQKISGFARETFITIDQPEEAGGAVQGIGGELTFVHKTSKHYTIEFVLEYGSASNDYLAALYIANQKSPGAGVVPVVEKDGLGRSFLTSAAGLIRKLPTTTKESDKGGTRTWTMDLSVEPGGYFPGGL